MHQQNFTFPDPSFTVENVYEAMEKVSTCKRRQVCERMLHESAVEEIYSTHSSEKDRLLSCANYVTCKPRSSWEQLVCHLYGQGEMVAAKKAKEFLQHKGNLH